MRIVLACLIAAVTAVAAGAGSPSSDLALGVDLGDASSKLAVVDRRGARVIVNRVGGRSTPSAVVFGLGGRASGEQTSGGLLARSPQLSMTRPRILLAAAGRAREMGGPKILVPDPAGADADTEDAAEASPSDYSGAVPQVRLDGPSAVAPLLGHLASTVHHALAEDERAWHGAPAAVVVAVPGGFTHGARRAVANAVKVAQAADCAESAKSGDGSSNAVAGNEGSGGDWAPDARVALLSDGSAAAFAYGFDRRAELAEEEAAAASGQAAAGVGAKDASKGCPGGSSLQRGGRIVLFVDIGHSKMEATAAALRSDGVCILGRAWDCGNGGTSSGGSSSSGSSSASIGSSSVSGSFSSGEGLPVCGASVDTLVLHLACEGLIAKHPSWASQLDPTPPRSLYAPEASTAGENADSNNKHQSRRSSGAASGKASSLIWDENGFPTRGGARLLEACRRTKITLSANAAATVAAERFGPNGEDAKCVIQRADLEALLLSSSSGATSTSSSTSSDTETATHETTTRSSAAKGSLCARAADCCRRALLAAGFSPPSSLTTASSTPEGAPAAAATPALPATHAASGQGAVPTAREVHSFELLGGGAYVPVLRAAVAGVAQEWSEHGLRQTCDPLETVTRGCALHAAALPTDARRAASAGRRRVVAVAPYQLTDCASRPVRALVRFVVKSDSSSSSSSDSSDVIDSMKDGSDDAIIGDSSNSSLGGGVSSSKAIAVTVCRAGAILPSATEVSVPICSQDQHGVVAVVVDLFEDTELPAATGTPGGGGSNKSGGSNGDGGGFLGRFVAYGPKPQPAPSSSSSSSSSSLIPPGSSADSASLRLRFALCAGDGVATVQAAALEWSTPNRVEKKAPAANAASTNSSTNSSDNQSNSSDRGASTNSSRSEDQADKTTPMNDANTEGAESAVPPPPPPPPSPLPRKSSMVLQVSSIGPTAAAPSSSSSSSPASSQSPSTPPLPPGVANALAAPSVPPPPEFACPLLAGAALDAAVAQEQASRRADAAAVSAAKAVNELEASVSVARQELEDFEFENDSSESGSGSGSSSSSDGSESADVWNKLAAESVALCADNNKDAGLELEAKPPPSLAFCLGVNGRAALQHAVEDASNFLETSPLERLSTHGLAASLEVVSQARQHASTLATVLAPATTIQSAALEWRAEQAALWKALRELEAALGDPPPAVRGSSSSSGSENDCGNSNGSGLLGRGSVSGLFGTKGSGGQPRRQKTESSTAASARQAAAEVREWLKSSPLKMHPLQAQSSLSRRPGEKALNRSEALVAAACAVVGNAQQKRANLEVWSTQLRTSSQAAEGAATLGAQARAAAADVQRSAAGLFGSAHKEAGGSDKTSSAKTSDNTNR